MATQIPQPITLAYAEINKGKYKSVRHFELFENSSVKYLLSDRINIRKDRGFGRSMPDYWLRAWENGRWSKTPISRLYKIDRETFYFGYLGEKKHLLIYKFSEDLGDLMIYYFENYFTNNLTKPLDLISQL